MKYGERELTHDPVGTSLRHVARDLKLGRTIEVCLEPGDCTRYDFIMSLVNSTDGDRYLVVVRTNGGVGGGVRASALLADNDLASEGYLAEEYSRLADGNEWTYRVLRWWFRLLWNEV